MNIPRQHNWDLTSEEAIALQQQLRSEIRTIDDLPTTVHHVAGVDVGFEEEGTVTRAAIAILTFPGLELMDRAIARRPTTFPYIPGLLSFREIPAVLAALETLQTQPQIFLCDGMGTAHPRRFGIASHLGWILDAPTIGVGKSRLVGTHPEVPNERGAWVPLQHKGDVIGAVLRTRVNTKPLYISPGHRVSLETAIAYVMNCTTKYRLPETTRQAHRLASGPAEAADEPLQISLWG
ncbi:MULTISPECIES: deoxyribonuclease V [unclassified Leptolyngbya]|uniref:deoxyribonuclease V n=1 Tax=unclassified Leptolyngbya TaxID=2650499 RepID=UPI00168677A2|nr:MULTISPECIES: deoxyribonuclease V [unclassified Leptolyngbya]MBD1911954.1 deoxyribonuclease V [Leptolyngbya sp. FACHB-8]MBD2158466.1 deoxyribonuclease V [Leptolyngbya sp. FACHB-16]